MREAHTPVMQREVMDLLALRPGMCVVDATVGCGGHAAGILERIGREGMLIGIDWDDEALAIARRKLASAGGDVRLRRGNFREMQEMLAEEGIEKVDAVLFDVGLSSLQLESAERGFSFTAAAPLDMRMDRRRRKTAAAVLGQYSPAELERLFREYGEEPLARAIAREIARRGNPPGTEELADLVRRIYARSGKSGGRIDPATKVFQALRIEVNDELENLQRALPRAVDLLRSGGRIVVISFHSLEDRIVKKEFTRAAKGCVCLPEFPVCRCGKTPILTLITRRPVRPSAEEVGRNPRARSARLRAAEKI
ncbi:MAG: 16S rRNA (cytosine(1402)-N(4))-methyltransferase RsmH [Candidatus Aureabacteria bacterium]|nr:16S rRNA (cytosine(1402)-N(4))-methyltransferase RsmH [Candidatus Auribacterota bacterium]